MKDLRFSITALAALFTFSLYLVGVQEAEEAYPLAGFIILPVLGLLLFVSMDD